MNEELTFNSKMALAYDKNTRISIPTYDSLFRDGSILFSISIG